MPVGEDSWRRAETAVCLPTGVLKEREHSISWQSSATSVEGLSAAGLFNLAPRIKKRRNSDVSKPDLFSAVCKRIRGREGQLLQAVVPHQRHEPSRQSKEPSEGVQAHWESVGGCEPLQGTKAQLSISGQYEEIFMAKSSLKEDREGSVETDDESERSHKSDCSSQLKFELLCSLKCQPSLQGCDAISSTDFDETGTRFATGGIARKIRICSYTSLVENGQANSVDGDEFEEEEENGKEQARRCRRGSRMRMQSQAGEVRERYHDKVALKVICTPAKLSSLKWRPLSSNVVGCGDYDGVVTEWDVERGVCAVERDGHSGTRVWSVDYSSGFPSLCASASSDGMVRVWSGSSETSVGAIRSPGGHSLCCAEFSRSGPQRLAVACADSNVYLYDLRRLDTSLLVLEGHRRAASYVRFLGEEQVVSASIDSTVKLWAVSRGVSVGCIGGDASARPRAGARLLRTFDSHVNVRNFVGLSTMEDRRLIACGSETNEVFVYNNARKPAVWQMQSHPKGGDGFPPTQCPPTLDIVDDPGFVGSVCWRPQHDHLSLIVANSHGIVQLIRVS